MASPESHFFTAPDGLRLHVRVFGDANRGRLPVVCLPGLTRNSRDFAGLAAFLAAEPAPRAVFAFDYRGRGLSEPAPDWRQYNVATEMQDVLAGLASLQVERAAFIGTSRGGLILHLLAAHRPEMVSAAVLNDVGPELGREGLHHIRSYLGNTRGLGSWPEAAASLQAIHGSAFPALSPADWDRMARALFRDGAGGPVPDYDPALVRSLDGLDLSKPLPDLWHQFDRLAAVPMLVIRGEHSMLLPGHVLAAMQRRNPAMQSLTVPGQGHAPLLETAGLPNRIKAFLESAER